MILLACCLTYGNVPTSGIADSGTRPNILLIMADDLGWKDLHCYGNHRQETPHLDRLAEAGTRFTAAYAASPVCTPTRAALLTGEAPARLQITNHAPGHPDRFQLPGTSLATPNWQRHLPLEKITLAEQLREAGYATGFVGKWHLSHVGKGEAGPREADLRPEHQGFDRNVGGCNFGGPPSYFAPFRNPAMPAGTPGDYLPDRCADACIEFVREHRERPFFLCWWNYSVHYPFEAPEELIRKYESGPEPALANPTYSAMIEGMDRAIGKLLGELERLDLDENTLVLFTSDNGPFAADVKPLKAEKGYLYEGGIRVPLMIRWPGKLPVGRVDPTPVVTMDLHATILDVCGMQPAPGQPADGVSLMPLLRDDEPLTREALFFHYPHLAFHKKNRMGSAIRAGNWKLICRHDGPDELYNLANDVGERSDLAEQEPVRREALALRLKRWLDETGAALPTPLHDEDDPGPTPR